MFENFQTDTVGYFSTFTVKVGYDGEYHKFGFIDVRSVPADADQEYRDRVMAACKQNVDALCETELRELGKIP